MNSVVRDCRVSVLWLFSCYSVAMNCFQKVFINKNENLLDRAFSNLFYIM